MKPKTEPAKPAGNPTLKWDPSKRPTEIKTDRGTFEIKENNQRKGL